MKRKFIIAILIFCICFPIFSSGCIAIATYNLVIESNAHNFENSYNSIKIDTVTANVLFRQSSNNESTVFCNEFKNHVHDVNIIDDTLTITQTKNEKWYEKVLNYTKSSIIIYLNQNQYDSLVINGINTDVEMPKGYSFDTVDIKTTTGDVKWKSNVTDTFSVNLTTGDIKLEGASFDKVNISNTTGDVQVLNCKFNNKSKITTTTGDITLHKTNLDEFIASLTTGYVDFTEIIASNKITIDVESGDVSLLDLNATELYIEVTTGNISARLLTDMRITAQASGQINVPTCNSGGICNVKTTTGNITIQIAPPAE